MNVIQVAGHIGRDAETRVTPGGQKVTSFTIAENVREGGQDTTYWYRVTIWGDQFAGMIPYLTKGKGIFVVGEFRMRTYQDNNGQEKTSLEINARMLSFSPFGRGQGEGGGQQTQAAGTGFVQQAASAGDFGGGMAGVGAMGFGGSAGQGDDLAVTGDNLPF
ncbi:MAG: single-stranded DNA-binding protein [Chlamydiia bacterium]|nr:single-stranded DNA-binding protein [Chlamydiia bacterium]